MVALYNWVGLLLSLGLVVEAVNFTTVYDWSSSDLDFEWPTEESKKKAVDSGDFMPENIFPYQLAAHGSRLFLGLLRVAGVPATLVSLPTNASAPPKLSPFPSWEFHEKKCDGIQMAESIAVDTESRLWVLDYSDKTNCPQPKLWIFDLARNDSIELVYRFPENTSLNEMVLDKTPDDWLAYLTCPTSDSLMAFSLKSRRFWTVATPGRQFDNVALSPDGGLYLRDYWSANLHVVAASELRAGRQSNATSKVVGAWRERASRLMVDSAKVLYASFFFDNYISTWNTSEPFDERRFYQGENIKAPFQLTFALDATATFWMTERATAGGKPRFKLLRAAAGAKPHLYP